MLSVLDVSALQEWSMGHSSGPAPAAVKCHSIAEQFTVPCLAVWDMRGDMAYETLPSKTCLVFLSSVTGLDSSVLLVDPFCLSKAA